MSIPLNPQLRMLRALLGYVLRVRPDALLAMLLGIVSSCIELASLACLVPLSQLAVFKPFQPESLMARVPQAMGFQPDAKFYVTLFLGLLLLRGVTQGLAGLMNSNLSRGLAAHFSSRALEAYVRHLTFNQVQSYSIGHFMALAGDETYRAANIVASLVRLVPLLFLFLLYAVVLFIQSWEIGVALLAFCLLVAACLFGAFRKSHTLGKRQQEEARTIGTHFAESLSGLRTIRSLNGEDFVTSRYDQMQRHYAHTWFSIDALNEFARNLPTVLLVTILLIASLFATNGSLTGTLPIIMVGVMMVLRLLPLAAQAMDTGQRLVADLKVADTINELLQAVKSAPVRKNNTLPALDSRIQSIEFNNVSFRYSDDTPEVLSNFSMRLEAGKSYAFSGPSGSGKSTIVDLLLKFFEPQSGSIKINGRDIAQISSGSLRHRIVLAEQATRIFYHSIEQNVLFGRNAGSQEVAATLEMVGLGELMATLPEGQNTLLNYQGSNISGGQRQRVGLARALLKASDVLIMDESTSALDHITRERILNNIFPRHREGILVFIAHDPSIVERVDEVIQLRPTQFITGFSPEKEEVMSR